MDGINWSGAAYSAAEVAALGCWPGAHVMLQVPLPTPRHSCWVLLGGRGLT